MPKSKLEINIVEANQPSEKTIQEFTDRFYQLMLKTEAEENSNEDEE